MAALPRFIAFQSKYNSKYLRYISEDLESRKLLQFSGDEVMSPFTKFQVLPSNDDNGLVHIRCCYNNKYLVRRSYTEWWITADADEPNEDRSSWSCTLFEPNFIENANVDVVTNSVVRLRHVQLGTYACLWEASEPYTDCWYATSEGIDPKDRCEIIDLESLVFLPKHIAFKGDNGMYLSVNTFDLQFSCPNINDSSVGYQVFIMSNGNILIKSNVLKFFWRRIPSLIFGWIMCDSSDMSGNNPNTLFAPVRPNIDKKNIIGLRSLGNGCFCKRFTNEDKANCLNAASPIFSNEDHLEFEELVASRKIYGVNYKIKDARIFDKHVVKVASGDAVINNNDVAVTMTIKLGYEDAKIGTWNSTTLMKMENVETNLETRIPRLKENGDFELEDEEILGSYKWGQPRTNPNSDKVKDVIVVVAPKSQIEVSLKATKASYDIPFSYNQNDNLKNGGEEMYSMNDGVFSGFNYYNFEVNKEEKPL